MDEQRFLEIALSASRTWDSATVNELSSLNVSDRIFGERRKSVLKADVGILWANWFIDSMLDPARYTKDEKCYVDVYNDARRIIVSRLDHLTKDEAADLSKLIAGEIWEQVKILRSKNDRAPFSKDQRYELLADAGPEPRCWLCGYKFSDSAISAFEEAIPFRGSEQSFIDVFKPNGLNSADSGIQIDHVESWSRGGRDDPSNLRLSCAWCNRNKSNHRSIYDVSGTPHRAGPNDRGVFSLPQKFWTVRLIASVRKCEHKEGCDCTIENSELTIEPINPLGIASPTNLRVVCADHHFLRDKRLLPRTMVAAIWGKVLE